MEKKKRREMRKKRKKNGKGKRVLGKAPNSHFWLYATGYIDMYRVCCCLYSAHGAHCVTLAVYRGSATLNGLLSCAPRH